MAESVARVRILAQIEGLEGFDRLKGAFKGLQQAIGPTDQQLSKARQDIIAFGEAGAKTEQVIRGQIDALKALKSQAGTGGQLYTTLGADIRRLEGEVRDLSTAYVNLATGARYTADQLRNLGPATRQPGMLQAQVRQMQEDLARFKLLSREYIQGIADINRAAQEGAKNQQNNNLFSNALNANPALQNAYFFDAAKRFEQQAQGGGLPATIAAKQTEISRLKEQLQNVLRDTSALEPLLNDIRRIEGRLAQNTSTSVGGARTTIPGLEGAGRAMGREWEESRIQLGQLAAEYDRLKRAQQDQVRVLETQLIEAENDLQRMLDGTTTETEQLNRAEERRLRIAEKLAAVQQATMKAPGVGGYRDPETGAMLARGTVGGRVDLPFEPRPPREISALYESIGQVGLTSVLRQNELMGNSYQEVAFDIRAATRASDGSLASLQRQRQAWEQLRATLSPIDDQYKAIERESRQAINSLDRRISKLQIGGRGGVAQIGQGVGAIGASGIFGGLEGLLGSLGGGLIGALGGPAGFASGAFIGGTVGAYASNLRQQAAGIADFVRDLNLAKTTLAQASTGQADYNKQLSIARQISKDYSVGLKETIQGYAQVAVAARANNLSLAETETIYRGLVASGTAFGKSQEDIDAIVRATVQVLSKGKLSAEELQGQIGERLPGAVAKFAEATGRSLPQLAKDLQSGQVQIADFVKFSKKQLKDYDEIAKIIGASPEKAGARLKLALDSAAESYGGFFQQIGASLQDSGTQMLSWLNSSDEMLKRLATFFWNTSRSIVGALKWVGEQLIALVRLSQDITKKITTFIPNLLLKPFGTDVDKLIIDPLAQGLKDQFNAYTDNYKDYFPEFTPGQFGAGPGGTQSGGPDPALEAAQKQEEALAEARKNAVRQLEDLERNAIEQMAELRKQTIKDIKKLEQDLGDDRLKVEREIDAIRRQSLFNSQQAALDRQIQELSSRGIETAGVEAERDLNAIFFEYSEKKISREQQAQDEALARNRKFEEFKTTIAEAIARIGETAAKQAGAIQRAYAQNVFDILEKAGKAAGDGMRQGAMDAYRQLSGSGSASGAGLLPTASANLTARQRALLDTIAFAEGTAGARGYQTMFTGRTFSSYDAHPRQLQTGGGYTSDAAGRYQFLSSTWERIARALELRDFSPLSQDRAALELIRRQGVNSDAPLTREALARLSSQWASFPTLAGVSAYGQPVKGANTLLNYYNQRLAAYGSGAIPSAPMLPGPGAPIGSTPALPSPNLPAAFDYKTLLAPVEAMRQALEGLFTKRDGAASVAEWNDQIIKLQEGLSGAMEPLDAITGESAKTLSTQQQINALIAQGYTPQLAEAKVGWEQMVEKERQYLTSVNNRLRDEIQARQTQIDSGTLSDKQIAKLKLEQESYGVLIQQNEQRLGQQGTLLQGLENEYRLTEEIRRQRELMQSMNIGAGFREGIDSYIKSIGTMENAISQLTSSGIKGLEDSLFDLFTTGTTNFKAFAAEILKQTTRIIIQQLILRTIMQAIGSLFGGGGASAFSAPSSGLLSGWGGGFNWMSNPMANGGAFAQNGIVPFATGGIVNQPTLFKFAQGGAMSTGVMGEAGPEAIMPLKRGRDGRLGVVSSGGGAPVTVNVSVDASGSQVQGNPGQGDALGRAVASAVQQELIRQKRPGGLLAA